MTTGEIKIPRTPTAEERLELLTLAKDSLKAATESLEVAFRLARAANCRASVRQLIGVQREALDTLTIVRMELGRVQEDVEQATGPLPPVVDEHAVIAEQIGAGA